MTPKEIVKINGKTVAKTFDLNFRDPKRIADFALVWVEKPHVDVHDTIYRDNYGTIRNMVFRYFPGARFLDAAMFTE